MKVNRGTSVSGAYSAGRAQNQKNISSLSAGDTFTATVAGVSGGTVSLSLAGGGSFMAKAKNTAGIAEGMQLSFTVEANENGQVYVRMSAVGKENVVRIATKTLTDAGMPLNDSNLEAVKTLIENGVAPDSEKLQKAAYAMTLKTMTPEKLLFFMSEGIDVNEGTLRQLNDNLLNKPGLTAAINSLIEKAASLPEGVQSDVASILFRGAAPQKTALAKSMKRLFFLDLAEGGAGASSLYKRLHTAVAGLLRGIGESEETKGFLMSAKSIKTALEFQNEIGQYKQYMQLPFIFEGKTGQGDLYVFADAASSARADKRITALLCLDLASVGHVEAFIVKTGKTVACTFGLSEQFVGFFKEKSFELHKLMAQKGIKLERVDFEASDGAFNLLKESPAERKKPEKRQMFSFDARA